MNKERERLARESAVKNIQPLADGSSKAAGG